MITAKVYRIFSLEIEGQIEEYAPSDPTNFGLQLRVMVGPVPGSGEESFDLFVCTPLWLEAECRRFGWVVGLHRIIVGTYDWALIDSLIRRLFERNSGSKWSDVAAKIARFGQWEFSDYEP